MSLGKIISYVLYYGLAIAFGLLFGLLQIPEPDYYLDGERVNHRMTSEEFILENIREVKTKTTVYLDKVPNVFIAGATGNTVRFLPSFTIEGDASTPSTINNCAIGAWVVLMVFLARALHLMIRRNRVASASSSEN